MYLNDIVQLDVKIPPLKNLKVSRRNINIWQRYRHLARGPFLAHPVHMRATMTTVIVNIGYCANVVGISPSFDGRSATDVGISPSFGGRRDFLSCCRWFSLKTQRCCRSGRRISANKICLKTLYSCTVWVLLICCRDVYLLPVSHISHVCK